MFEYLSRMVRARTALPVSPRFQSVVPEVVIGEELAKSVFTRLNGSYYTEKISQVQQVARLLDMDLRNSNGAPSGETLFCPSEWEVFGRAIVMGSEKFMGPQADIDPQNFDVDIDTGRGQHWFHSIIDGLRHEGIVLVRKGTIGEGRSLALWDGERSTPTAAGLRAEETARLTYELHGKRKSLSIAENAVVRTMKFTSDQLVPTGQSHGYASYEPGPPRPLAPTIACAFANIAAAQGLEPHEFFYPPYPDDFFF